MPGLNGPALELKTVEQAVDKRKFQASFSVKVDTNRVRFELASAVDYGGPEGFFRIRSGRRWINGADGKPRFFDKTGLARLLADIALGDLASPSAPPEIPYPSRVSVKVWRDGMPDWFCAWTTTPPILDYSGRWVVCVSMDGTRQFVPVEDVTVHPEKRRG